MSWLRRHPGARLAVSASVLYLLVAPLWGRVSVPYNRALTAAYGSLAPLVEHPRLTDEIEWVEGSGHPARHVVSKQVARGGFTFAVAYLYGIDLAILLTLAAVTPAAAWRRKLAIVAIGAPILVATHVVALATTVRASYAQVPLVNPALRPGTFAIELNGAARSILMSEITLALPILLWAGLSLWLHQRAAKAGPRGH